MGGLNNSLVLALGFFLCLASASGFRLFNRKLPQRSLPFRVRRQDSFEEDDDMIGGMFDVPQCLRDQRDCERPVVDGNFSRNMVNAFENNARFKTSVDEVDAFCYDIATAHVCLENLGFCEYGTAGDAVQEFAPACRPVGRAALYRMNGRRCEETGMDNFDYRTCITQRIINEARQQWDASESDSTSEDDVLNSESSDSGSDSVDQSNDSSDNCAERRAWAYCSLIHVSSSCSAAHDLYQVLFDASLERMGC